MNKQMKNLTLVGMMILLTSACGGLGTTPAPADTPEPVVAVTESPAGTAEVVSTEGSTSQEFSQYIGLNYPPLPSGLSEGFGMIIQDSNDYALSLVIKGVNKMLWLSKMTHRDASGVAYWQVMDVLNLSNLEAGLTLIPDGCFLNGVPDSEIFIVGRNGVIVLAWRANTRVNKFEVIPTSGIKCDSDKAVSLE